MAGTASTEFHNFVVSQVMRLGANHGFQYTPEKGLEELRDWIKRKAGCDKTRVRMLIDSAVELDRMPSVSDLIQIWHGLWPVHDYSTPVLSRRCSSCDGRRWIIVHGANQHDGSEVSGAVPCHCSTVGAQDVTGGEA